MPDQVIYHITTRSAWEAAQQAGVYRPESLATQGFIHLSTADQVYRVANAVYRGTPDLLLLSIQAAGLGDALRYESPDLSLPTQTADAELFPHLYSALPLSAVVGVQPLVPQADGSFSAD